MYNNGRPQVANHRAKGGDTMAEDKQVFQKLDSANTNGKGVELSATDVWLLMEMVGDEIGQAGGRFEECEGMLRDYELYKRREQSDNNQRVL